jgi:creatinine amidohydrolase
MRRCIVASVLALGASLAGAQPPLRLEALTWTELRDRVAAGATTVLVPIGGTEQNGPHMALGKHNRRALVLAERIAERLGDALVV